MTDPNNYALSSLDILGTDLMYPRQYTHVGAGDGSSFSGSGGSRLIVRNDGWFTSDWRHRAPT
jgi:hypothetical protein